MIKIRNRNANINKVQGCVHDICACPYLDAYKTVASKHQTNALKQAVQVCIYLFRR